MKTTPLRLSDNNQVMDSDPGAKEVSRRETGVAQMAGRRDSHVSPSLDPEVPEKKARRNFTAKYKLQILAEADTCSRQGQLGALLRREGLYSSNLASWRRLREKGLLKVMAQKKRGRKCKEINPLAKRVALLEKENRLLQQKIKKAELIIETQKKMSELLEIAQDPDESNEPI